MTWQSRLMFRRQHGASSLPDEDLIDHKPDPNRPERTVTLCRTCRNKGREHVVTARPDLVITADLSIPAFLRRTPPGGSVFSFPAGPE